MCRSTTRDIYIHLLIPVVPYLKELVSGNLSTNSDFVLGTFYVLIPQKHFLFKFSEEYVSNELVLFHMNTP